MYDHIITVYEEASSQLNMHIENEVFSIIKRYNIDVNKDELIRALDYDRNQYDKGYADGVRDFYTKLIDKATTTLRVRYGETEPSLAYSIYQEELDEILNELGVLQGDKSDKFLFI